MFWDLFFPRYCIGCGCLGQDLCAGCHRALRPRVRHDVPGVISCWSAGSYDGWLRAALLRYKGGDSSMLAGLSHVLLAQVKPQLPVTIVPVPTSKAKVRERGYDTIGLLAKRLGGRTAPVLQWQRIPRDQVGLNASARRANLQGAMWCTRLISGPVLLVDDVVTTGATLAEAARALRIAGAEKVDAICVCTA